MAVSYDHWVNVRAIELGPFYDQQMALHVGSRSIPLVFVYED